MKKVPPALSCLLMVALLLVSAGCTQAGPRTPSPSPSPVLSPSLSPAVPSDAREAVYTSNETLVAFVENASAYVKIHGAAESLALFNNQNGSFTRGELYIYAYGFNGTTLAHPVNPETVGKTREGSIGVFVTEMGAVVRNGSGYYRFTYVNPAHNNTLESKLGYGVKIDDTWWIGSGVYTGPVGTPAAPSPATTGA